MGCTAFLNEVDPVTGEVNLTHVVLNLQRQDQREFLGFGIFETTAVVVAVFVAGYVLVGDPTGTQHAQDVSEYTVYAQWRWAMLFLIGDLGFMLAVLAHELVDCWRGSDVSWLVLLMFAPWAPVARQVRLTLGAWSRVRTMMRARMVSNTLAAVLREGFYLGYPGISTAAVGGFVFQTGPPDDFDVPDDLTDDKCGTIDPEDNIRSQIRRALARSSGLPQTKSALRHGPQLTDSAGFGLWWFKHMPCLDPLAIRWSMEPLVPLKDPFFHLWPEPTQGTPSRWTRILTWPHFVARATSDDQAEASGSHIPSALPFKRVRILDVIDLLQPGGTVSEARLQVLHSHAVCERCIMAVRAAVEAFLESSSRQHAGARVARWFKGVTVKWYGGVAPCLDMMWEACFSDNAGLRVDGDPGSEGSAKRPPVSSTDLTSWFLLFLFLVSRSLLHEACSLSRVDALVRTHLRPDSLWPLFWDAMRAKLAHTSPTVGATFKVQSDKAVELLMDDALVDTVDAHVVGAVVNALCDTLMDPSDYPSSKGDVMGLARLCDVDTCILHKPQSLLTFTRTARPPTRRRPASATPTLPA